MNRNSRFKILGIIMLAVPGGQERTEPEYRRLLDEAGFKLTRVVPTVSAVSVVEAVRLKGKFPRRSMALMPALPPKRTLVERVAMSALCQKRTRALQQFCRGEAPGRESQNAGTDLNMPTGGRVVVLLN